MSELSFEEMANGIQSLEILEFGELREYVIKRVVRELFVELIPKKGRFDAWQTLKRDLQKKCFQKHGANFVVELSDFDSESKKREIENELCELFREGFFHNVEKHPKEIFVLGFFLEQRDIETMMTLLKQNVGDFCTIAEQ